MYTVQCMNNIGWDDFGLYNIEIFEFNMCSYIDSVGFEKTLSVKCFDFWLEGTLQG